MGFQGAAHLNEQRAIRGDQGPVGGGDILHGGFQPLAFPLAAEQFDDKARAARGIGHLNRRTQLEGGGGQVGQSNAHACFPCSRRSWKKKLRTVPAAYPGALRRQEFDTTGA
ncbi:hypothetical protein D3C81_1644460 [compost metagenome]